MASPGSDADSTSPPVKKRRWPKVLACILIFAIILGWGLNGPILRIAAQHLLKKELTKQNIEGTVEISGTLLTGLSHEKGQFQGTAGIQELSFEKLAVHYSIRDLIEKKAAHIEATNLTAVIDIAKFPPSKKEKKPFDLDQTRKSLATARTHLLPLTIDLSEIDITLLKNEQALSEISFASLTHPPEQDIITIEALRVSDGKERATPTQDLSLTWSDKIITLDQLSPFPEVILSNFTLSAAPQTPLDAKTTLKLLNSTFTVTAPTLEEATIQQDGDPLNFKDIATLLEIEIPVSGTLNKLDLSVKKRSGVCSLQVRDFRYQDYKIKNIDLQTEISETLATLDGKLAEEKDLLLLKASLPIEAAQSFEDLKGRTLTAKVDIPALERLSDFSPQVLPNGVIGIKATHLIGSQDVSADFTFKDGIYQKITLPKLTGNLVKKGQSLETVLDLTDARDQLAVKASYHLEDQTYRYQIDGTIPARSQLAEMVTVLEILKPLELTTSGSGNLKKQTHLAKGGLASVLRHTESRETTTVATRFEIDWPKSFAIPTLGIDHEMGALSGGISWEDSRLKIDALEIADRQGHLLTVDGEIPLPLETANIDDLIKNEEEVDLTITAKEFSLARIRDIFPMIQRDLSGRLNGKMKLGGTFAKPRLDGSFTGSEWALNSFDAIEPLGFSLSSTTENDTLKIQGKINEGGKGFAEINGRLPVTMTEWLQKEDAVSKTPIDLTLQVKDLSLERFRKVVPQLERVNGQANIDLIVKGTIAEPTFLGKARLDAERIRFENEQIPDLRDSHIEVSFDGKEITISPSSFYGSGGEYQLSGRINIEGDEPAMNIKLDATRALIWRDDSLSLRSDGELRLNGTMSEATLSGSLDVAESLYYKDFEIIPFGVPAGTVPSPEIPSAQPAGNSTSIPIPAPYGNWKLDVRVGIKDPILIRGNLAQGQLEGQGRIRGILAEPQITLDTFLKDGEAELPLSKLKLKTSKITLRPGQGFIPTLNIRGESRVGQHQVFIFAYGKANSPTLVFTSNPPLPEAEVLTLLATGTTTSGLEDQQIASVKAFQLLLSELRRKYGGKQARGGMKVVSKVLDALDDVDLRVGDNDPFSGRRFNSATLQLSSKFYASAAVDEEGNPRGILIYSLRF